MRSDRTTPPEALPNRQNQGIDPHKKDGPPSEGRTITPAQHDELRTMLGQGPAAACTG